MAPPEQHRGSGFDRPRDLMGWGLAGLTRIAGSPLLDRFGLRGPLLHTLSTTTRTSLRTAGAASRGFAAVKGSGTPHRPAGPGRQDLFDLTPSDEQRMIVDIARDFAAEQLRPLAAEADTAGAPPETVMKRAAAELGVTLLTVPETLGGAGSERSATAAVLLAEALAHGDLGLAVACLAPAAVSTALTLWGDANQQATYLPAFVGDQVPHAALALTEPRPLFDPFELRTTARRAADGWTLEGEKSLVALASSAELFVVAADTEDGPGLFLVESDARGLTVEPEPAMGLRAAATGRVRFEGVRLPGSARLATGTSGYADCVRLARIGWSALAVGTAQAVLDYVIPYVNDRVAFGEPISHRQGVAFMVADIGIELEGMRLATYRAASRAKQGRSFAREAALARRLSTEYGMKIGSSGVQLLGGHGYVKEHPVERWYRDLRAIGVMEGTVLV